jgi:hypothetical protein
VEECFLLIFFISKFWINGNPKISNLVEFTLEKKIPIFSRFLCGKVAKSHLELPLDLFWSKLTLG